MIHPASQIIGSDFINQMTVARKACRCIQIAKKIAGRRLLFTRTVVREANDEVHFPEIYLRARRLGTLVPSQVLAAGDHIIIIIHNIILLLL